MNADYINITIAFFALLISVIGILYTLFRDNKIKLNEIEKKDVECIKELVKAGEVDEVYINILNDKLFKRNFLNSFENKFFHNKRLAMNDDIGCQKIVYKGKSMYEVDPYKFNEILLYYPNLIDQCKKILEVCDSTRVINRINILQQIHKANPFSKPRDVYKSYYRAFSRNGTVEGKKHKPILFDSLISDENETPDINKNYYNILKDYDSNKCIQYQNMIKILNEYVEEAKKSDKKTLQIV